MLLWKVTVAYWHLSSCRGKLPVAEFINCRITHEFLSTCQSAFHKQILIYCCSLRNNPPSTIKEILQQPIWYNENICVDRKPVYYKKWWQKGIMYLYQLLDNNGQLLTQDNLENKYAIKTNFLMYRSLIKSIPKHWLDIVGNQVIDTETQNVNRSIW